MRVIIALVLALTAVSVNPQRIVGGTVTTIDQYPSIVALLRPWVGQVSVHFCGGSILNNRSILTAAHCFLGLHYGSISVRAGSTSYINGGIVHFASQVIHHPSFNVAASLDADISILRISGSFTFSNVIQPGLFASANYNLGDNEVVWAAGWGSTLDSSISTELLRHVHLWTVNQATCIVRLYPDDVTDNMLCTGNLDVGGTGQCSGDSGGPLYHNGVIVGVTSFGVCASAYYPTVSVRVSRFASWIQNNA